MRKPSGSGHYEKFGEHEHFVPDRLPPSPEFHLDTELIELFGEAMQSLGRLGEVQNRIPDKSRFLNIYIAKEAVYSSQIENINTTLTQVLEYNSEEKSENKDVQEVHNYIAALNYGVQLMRKKNLPISSRLIKECHKKLLSGVRGEGKMPGQYRKVAVFVGKLVPPPAHYIEDHMYDLEKFINHDHSLHGLIKTGLAHVQFETIHPFLDGNGRIGRLLIVLIMIEYGLISEPVLYPSFFFMKYRSEYYDRLDSVRTKGDYEGWIKYYLRGIRTCANDVVERAWAIDGLLKQCVSRLKTNSASIKRNADVLLDQLCATPVISTNDVKDLIDSTHTTAQRLVDIFVDADILVQADEKQRNKMYRFKEYLDILEKEFDG